MTIAMQRPIHAELSGGGLDMFFDLLYKVRGERLEFRVDLFRCNERKLSSPARLESVANHLQRVVDRRRVDGRLIKSTLFPAPKNDQHALVPKGKVSK